MDDQSNKATSWTKVLSIGLAGSLVVALVSLAFLWPAKVAEPRDYPIAITGANAQQVTAIKDGIEQNAGDAIEFVDVENREEAVRKIEHREVFGAIVINMPSPEVLTASANGQATNAVMTTMASTMQAKVSEMAAQAPPPKSAPIPSIKVKTTDIVPAHAAKFDVAQLGLPLVFGGIIGGAAIARLVRGRWQRLSALAMYALFAGGILYLVVQSWFDLLPANFWGISGAFSLGIFATASFVTGAQILFGMRGFAIAVATTMLLANPLAGLAIPTIFLPEPWGAIGQGLTIGATGTLLRMVSYFPVADMIAPLVVLGAWSTVGALAVASKK